MDPKQNYSDKDRRRASEQLVAGHGHDLTIAVINRNGQSFEVIDDSLSSPVYGSSRKREITQMNHIASFLLLCLAPTAWAAPLCLPTDGVTKEAPEACVEKLLQEHKIPETEIFTRLVFSEGLASECSETTESDGVLQGIAWVIRNRVNAKTFGAGAKVVTAPKQFRSTFGTYDVSRRNAFLCPESAGKNWQETWQKAEKAWTTTADPNNPLPGVHNYYLEQHFKNSKLKFGPPSWAKAPNEEHFFNGVSKGSPCIRFWKIRTTKR